MGIPLASSALRVPRALGACLFGIAVSGTLGVACAAERVTIDDEPETGASRSFRDGGSADSATVPPADANLQADAPVPPRDAARDGPPTLRDAEADAASPPRRLVVSEVFAADILSRRYVELAGPPSMLIGDLKLRIVSDTGVVLKSVDVGKRPTELMPARGTWVVGGLAGPSVDNGLLVSDWDLPSDSGSVQLVRVGAAGDVALLDVVGYGTPAAQVQSVPTESKEGTAAMSPGQKALLRKPSHVDTGNNLNDFCRGASSPNRANVCDP